MRILQILPELNVGGVETGTVDLAQYLTEHGHAAIVVSSGGPLASELEKMGIKHYRLPVHQKSLTTIWKSIQGLKKIIEDEKVDIVHARSRVPAWIAYFACRDREAQFLTTCHGYYANHFFSRVMGWPKLVIVPSEIIGKHMITTFGVSAQNIRLIPRSVDLKKFQIPRPSGPGQSEFVISIVGRITPLKGHLYFLKAMAKVVRSIPYVKIWIIGDSPRQKEAYKRELKTAVRRLGLSGHVEFLGTRHDIPELLSKTDVVVLATVTHEAFGRVILEAQAAGAAVVATRVGGVVDVIDDGATGLLVPPRDPDSMAEAVVRIWKDRKFAQSLIREAQKKLEAQFTLERMATKTLKVYQELLKSLNILVVKLSSVGDTVLVTASLRALREKYPWARISCLVGRESQKVLQGCPTLDEVIVFDGEREDKGPFGLLRFSRKLRARKFDKVIDFQNNRKSHLLSFLSFPKESYGYDRKWGFLLRHRIRGSPARTRGPVEHQFQILKMLKIDCPDYPRLELWPSIKDQEYVQSLLDSEWLGNAQNIVGVNIAASRRWETKNWPLEYIARLCDVLSEKNIRVLITGLPDDKEAARQLLKLTKSKPAVFVGKTDIPQLASLIKRCKVFVTPDSAPMHVAAAVGTPFVAFFGPTDPNRHLPPAEKCVVLKRELPCSPCYSSRCLIKTHECMRDILPEEVAERIEKLIVERTTIPS